MPFRLDRTRLTQIILASLCFLAPLFLAFSVPRAAVSDAWRPIGMDDNRILDVQLLPTSDEVRYFAVGSGLGVWERDPATGHWASSSSGLPKGTWGQVPSVLLAATTDDQLRLYVGLGDRPDAVGFYRQDYPGIWLLLRSDFEREVIRAVASAPFSFVVYVATARQVYRSTDQGLTWDSLSHPPGSGAPVLIRIHPRDPNEIWLGTSVGEVYISHDQGRTWTLSLRLPLERWVHAIEIDAAEPSVAYVGAGASVYVTRNGGASWTRSATGLGQGFVMALLVDPATRGTVFLGSSPDGMYYTTDYGGTWQSFREGMGRLGVNALALDPADNETLVAATDDGVWSRSLAWMRGGERVQVPLPFTPTPSPTRTPVPGVTRSPTPTRTSTRTPSPTFTAAPTDTPTHAPVRTQSLAATVTPTLIPSPTPSLEPTSPVEPPITSTPTRALSPTPTRPPR